MERIETHSSFAKNFTVNTAVIKNDIQSQRVNRRIPDALRHLLLKPQKFSIHQALRIVEHDWLKKTIAYSENEISLLPASELSFPASDIRRCHIHSSGKISLELNFMGLYGVDSPLPLYFSQLAAQDTDVAKRIRRFLTIINNKIYIYHYLAWKQQNYFMRFEQNEKNYCQLLSNLSKIPHCAETLHVLNYTGMFLRSKRSDKDLASVIRNYFNGVEVKVEKFIPSVIKMTEKSQLGTQLFLYKNSFLGDKIPKIDRIILIVIGPLCWEMARNYFLNSSQKDLFNSLLRFFIPKKMAARVQIKLDLTQSHQAVLGSQAMLLNWHAVLGKPKKDYYVIKIQSD